MAVGSSAPALGARRSQFGNVRLSTAQKETPSGAPARGSISVAHQSARRRPWQSLAVLHAIKSGGGSLQEPQRRFSRATDLSSTRTPDRGAHLRKFPGLLRARELAGEGSPAGTGTERTQRA